jgi:triphosphatase
MEYEIELKLLTNDQAGNIIEKKLLPQINASITQETLVLTNHYFDTPDRALRQHYIGLRIRGNNQKFEQTLKTAGKSIGGLHQRPEYNVLLDGSKEQTIPDLKLFPTSVWPNNIDVDILQSKIETLFTTHFQRKIYLLEFTQGDIVELVWDFGEVTSGNKSVAICEVELELKKGTTTSLFNLAKLIVGLMPTTIGTDSKAALGYTLLDGLCVKKLGQYEPVLPENMQNEAEIFAGTLTAQLEEFQMFSAKIRREYSQELATNIKHILVALVANLAKFSHHFPCTSLVCIHMDLKNLLNDWSLVTQPNDKNMANDLLVKAQTTQLQLNIVQCLVEQPWCSDI